MNKREFIKRSIVIVGGISTALSAHMRGASMPNTALGAHRKPTPVGAVVIDERFSDARAFASEFTNRGAALFETRQDIGQLWYGPLRSHLESRGENVAGLTTYSDFYVIQSAAREQQLRVVYECSHDCRGRQELTHLLRAGVDPRLVVALEASLENWPSVLGGILSQFDLRSDGRVPFAIKTTARRAADNPGVLVSWLLSRP